MKNVSEIKQEYPRSRGTGGTNGFGHVGPQENFQTFIEVCIIHIINHTNLNESFSLRKTAMPTLPDPLFLD